MPQENTERLIERAKKSFGERDSNRGMMEDAMEIINPFRNTYSGQKDSHNKPSKQFDSTAMIAANNFVNTMQSKFTPPFARWAELKAGPGVPEKQRKAMNKELAKLTDVVFTYLNASNFSNASAEMWWDLGFGTGCMFVLEGDETNPLNFVTVPGSQIGLEEGTFSSVWGIFRERKCKGRLITATWKDAKLPKDLADSIKEKGDQEVDLVEAIYWDNTDMVWRYEVLHEGSKSSLLMREFGEDVALTPRWMKIPGYNTGIGPFLLAMADYKTLNKMKELSLKMAALNVFGTYTVANNAGFNANTAVIRPGAFIPVERNGGPNGPSIAALPSTGNFQIQEFMMNDLKDQIRQVMLDNRLPQESSAVRSAFEISQRIKELSTDIGAAFGRLYFEFVQKLFRRVVAILQRKGLIQLPEGFDIDNFFVQVQVTSAIAQTQAVEDVQKFTQAFSIIQGISPQLALMAVEVEAAPDWLFEKIGAPATLLRSEDGKQQMQQMVAQMIAATQAQAAAGQNQPAPAPQQ